MFKTLNERLYSWSVYYQRSSVLGYSCRCFSSLWSIWLGYFNLTCPNSSLSLNFSWITVGAMKLWFLYFRWWPIFHRLRPHPAVAVSSRTSHGQELPKLYRMDWRWLGVQIDWSRRSGATLGYPQKQAQNELWETKSRSSLLLWQKHHSQDVRKTICLSFRLWSTKDVWVSYSIFYPILVWQVDQNIEEPKCGAAKKTEKKESQRGGSFNGETFSESKCLSKLMRRNFWARLLWILFTCFSSNLFWLWKTAVHRGALFKAFF